MLFQPIVRESVVFYVLLFCCIPLKNYIFPYMLAVSSLFSLLTKGSYKIRQMKLQNVRNRGSFFPTNVAHKCFLREACGKQISRKKRLLGTYGT